MLDVVRNLWRPPSEAQKATDVKEVLEGRELLVACRLPRPKAPGIHWVSQGYLHVFQDKVVWQGRHYPEMTFKRGEWWVRTTPNEPVVGQFGIVSLENKASPTIHQELRVPTPDLDLIRAVLSD
jgi:hypothetical protein